MDSTYLHFPLSKRSFEPRSHPCSTKNAPSSSQTWKSTRKASPHKPLPKEQMHTKTVFNHNKLCIYYAKIKSFTDSLLIVLSIQGTATNCKGIAMKASSKTMNVRINEHSELTWRSMCKETCTYNELGEFLMVLGIESTQDTAHWKTAKKNRSLLPTRPHSNTMKLYRTHTGFTASNHELPWTMNTIYKIWMPIFQKYSDTASLSMKNPSWPAVGLVDLIGLGLYLQICKSNINNPLPQSNCKLMN